MHVEKPVTTDVCFKTEAAVIVFLVFPSSSSGQKTQEKEKPLQIRERQSGDGIGSVKSDYMKAIDGLQKKIAHNINITPPVAVSDRLPVAIVKLFLLHRKMGIKLWLLLSLCFYC